ncbi:hypothetical protein BDW59DRAFT_145496 [Aspergillus cavernicola]|uniref:Alpha/beta hydrolase fold-3 domain-containing protein n=1 Tax=Aspergillus cavernicola TaxID=176166 RepID=A0ABR4IGT5_9EURO
MLIFSLRLHSRGVLISATTWRPRIIRPPRRHQSSATPRFASTRINGIYEVPVGSNGRVSLSVYHPKLVQSPANVIIRLPQGPIFQKSGDNGDNSFTETNEPEDLSISRDVDTASAWALADITAATVVTINYRLGALPSSEDKNSSPSTQDGGDLQSQEISYRYPTPVHDTLIGFDWVLQNLQPTRLGVVGTHIGGSLALMLALTEPSSVHAVAALDPICDWTSLDEYCTSSGLAQSARRKRHQAPRDLVPLLEAREKFFSAPEKYFDSFASPVLFLRSAGKDVPKMFPKYLTGPEHPVPVLDKKESEDPLESWDAYLSEDPFYDGAEPSNLEELDANGNRPPVRRRKALSRWPPYGLDYGTSGPRHRYSRDPIEKLEVILPPVRLFTRQDTRPDSDIDSQSPSESDSCGPRKSRRKRNQNETVLAHQAIEMVDVMRRACFWGREKGFAEERVTLSPIQPNNSFDSEPGSRDSDTDFQAGEWLAETLNLDPDTESNA